jgi:hypothetical protein
MPPPDFYLRWQISAIDVVAKCHHCGAMDEPNDFHAALIRGLGGKARLAERLGLERDVLTKWHVRGIPSRYWHRVIELAHEAQIAVTAEQLDRTKPAIERAA